MNSSGWSAQTMMPLSRESILSHHHLHGLLIVVTFALAFIPAYTFFSGSPLRFITYLVPILGLAYWLALSAPRLMYDTRFLVALGIYSLLLTFSAFTTLEIIDKMTWTNALRPVFYLLIFVPYMLFDIRAVRILVGMYAITMLFQSFVGGTHSETGFSLSESRGLLESGLAFPLGAMLIFCLRYKQKWLTLIVFILFLIAFKRIAILSVLVVCLFMAFNIFMSRNFGIRESILALCLVVMAAAGAVMLNIYYFEFFRTAAELLNINQSLYTLTLGRTDEFQILAMQSGEQSLWHVLFGGGPGYATRNLVEVTIDYPLQVHNSYLLHYYDFGVVGFGLFMLGFFIIYSRNVLGMYLYAYNLIVMITDNSYTHHYYQFTCFILIAAAHTMDTRRGEKLNR